MNDKDLREIRHMNSLGKWYSWDSPIGLAIFFIALSVVAILVRFFFLMK